MAPAPNGAGGFGDPGFGVGGGVLLLGKLMRRDRRLFTWKWRDFILERNRLQYFSEKGLRKGDIRITPTTPITIRLTSEPKPFGFLLFIKDEKLTLAAQNEMERRKWIDVFCDVFHASVEQAPTDSKSERRARPTFLPIPDLNKPGSSSQLVSNGHVNPLGGSSKSLVGSPELDKLNTPGVDMDVIPILESRMTYGPLKEMYSRITFPPSLANGDLLVGVGPIVRRMGWTDERILAVGMYIDPEVATTELDKFNGRTTKSLYGDQTFYNHLLYHTTFRRTFVITARKRVSKSVLTAVLHDELAPRMGPDAPALLTFFSFIEKSLKKAESMVLRIHEDGRFEYRQRGQLYPPIASNALCKTVQALFFDNNSIQHDAKRGLIDRLPSLWGAEILDAQDEIFGSISEKRIIDLESDDDDDDEDYDDFDFDDKDYYDDEYDIDEDDDAEYEVEDTSTVGRASSADSSATGSKDHHENTDSTSHETRQSSLRQSALKDRESRVSRGRRSHAPRRTLSMKEELDEQDEHEHELMRRESRNLVANFGPLQDPISNATFVGDLLLDGSSLLGTWSQQIAVAPDAVDAPHSSQSHRITTGLYVDPGAASECLLKYKGLSVGSILQDPDFFARFARGSFAKHLVVKIGTRIAVDTLLDYLDTCLRPTMPTGDDEIHKPESLRDTWLNERSEKHSSILQPKDEVRFSITTEGKMTMTIKRRGSASSYRLISATNSDENSIEKSGAASDDTDGDDAAVPGLMADETIALPPPPFSLQFQSIFYGFHASDAASRAQLMQRLPNLLDLAKDDLVHTYHDEIQVLKENYKRQRPENRVKVGYLLISFEKTKMLKNADTGMKVPTVVASRWSKRWCRLDGTLFSYYSHKRSRKYRDIMELTRCEVVEVTATSNSELSRFAWSTGETDSIRIAIVKPNGEILALRTESIYEGEEWLESLMEASRVRRSSDASLAFPGAAGSTPWDNSVAQLRRRSSSSHRLLRGNSTSQLVSERANSVAEELMADDGGRRSSDVHAPVTARHSIGSVADLDREADCTVDKEGSLVAWVQEDARHAVIVFLLLVIVWLVTARHVASRVGFVAE